MATTVQESKSGTTSGAKSYPIYVAGEWQTSQEPLAVRNPFSGDVIGVTYQASRDQLEQAIGPDVLNTLSQQTGLSREELLSRLTRELPAAVDKFTPEGRLPTEDEAARLI